MIQSPRQPMPSPRHPVPGMAGQVQSPGDDQMILGQSGAAGGGQMAGPSGPNLNMTAAGNLSMLGNAGAPGGVGNEQDNQQNQMTASDHLSKFVETL